ncbi:hypothetical protein DFH09DRAFT_1334040 [Mycena vulgaris]|nr:hypothetical protein DFH09DRAFT_1334040 [Mycena vulgaris]
MPSRAILKPGEDPAPPPMYPPGTSAILETAASTYASSAANSLSMPPPPSHSTQQGNITPTYANQGIQVGKSWTTELLRETYTPHLTQDRRFDRILTRLQRGGWSVGTFLEKLLQEEGKKTRDVTDMCCPIAITPR